MKIELWSKPIELGQFGDDQTANHLWVKDSLRLTGDLKFQNLLRLQVCAYVHEPCKVQVIIDHEGIQFLVDQEIYEDLVSRFSGIVANFIRDYIEQRDERISHGL